MRGERRSDEMRVEVVIRGEGGGGGERSEGRGQRAAIVTQEGRPRP